MSLNRNYWKTEKLTENHKKNKLCKHQTPQPQTAAKHSPAELPFSYETVKHTFA